MADCKVLIDKVPSKIRNWACMTLSYAGRLKLIKYVLFSSHICWTMHFILPKSVCLSIKQLFRNFLWTGTESYHNSNKVAWSFIGGLGLRRIQDWNQASFRRHIWDISSSHNSLWVQWCYTYVRKCFWTLPIPANYSWTWKKIIKLRTISRPFIRYVIGNEENTFLWFDNWHLCGAPL